MGGPGRRKVWRIRREVRLWREARRSRTWRRERQELEEARPRVRGDCQGEQRPCPWVGCRWSLVLRVQRNGTILLNLRDWRYERSRALNPAKVSGGRRGEQALIDAAADLVFDLAETCALDVADRGGLPGWPEVGDLLGVDRERVRQVAASGMDKLRRESEVAAMATLVELDDEDEGPAGAAEGA